MMCRWFVIVAVLSLVMLGAERGPGLVAAQTDQAASPVATNQDIGLSGVSAEDCRIERRPSEEVFALLGLAEGTEATTSAGRTPVPSPPWIVADRETVDAVTRITREWLACINADDNFRIAALMTDGALVRFFGGGLAAGEAVEGARANLAGTPVPRTAEEYVRLLAVSDVSLLDDGRVAALALVNEPAQPPHGQETLLVIFAQVDNRLRIDDVVQFSLAPTTAATPRGGGTTTGSVTVRIFACPANSNQPIGWDATAAEFQAYENDLLAVCTPEDDPAVAPALVTPPDQQPTTPGTHIAPGVYEWTDVPFGDYALGGGSTAMPAGLGSLLLTLAGVGPIQNPAVSLDAETPDVEYHYFYFLTAATPESNSTS
jgi:hypothetical protein